MPGIRGCDHHVVAWIPRERRLGCETSEDPVKKLAMGPTIQFISWSESASRSF
jgi:hypothetical protein